MKSTNPPDATTPYPQPPAQTSAMSRIVSLASFLGMAGASATGCTTEEICAPWSDAWTWEHGASNIEDAYRCLDGSGNVFGNTLDPICAWGDVSCSAGAGPMITKEACEAAGHTWSATTCDGYKLYVPTNNCSGPPHGGPHFPPHLPGGSELPKAFYPVQSTCCVQESPCFPSMAMITLADGTASRVDALKEGDKIVAATADGSLTTDTVSLLSIARPEATVDKYITLTTAANTSLTLTPTHHLPVGPVCCSTLKMAKDVSIGEVVHLATEGETTPSTVTTMRVAKAMGLHSPVLTNGNFPIVDGFVTSFDSIEKVTLAKYGLASLVSACKASGTCETLRHLFLGEDHMLI